MLFLHIHATSALVTAEALHCRISRCPEKVAGMAVHLLNEKPSWRAYALALSYVDTDLSAFDHFYGLQPVANCQGQQ